MAEPLGWRLYRGLLKTGARVWNPTEIHDADVLRKVLAQMQGAERGLRRLEAALNRVGPEILDAVLLDGVRYLEVLATESELEPLGDTAQVRYEVPAAESAVLTNMGIPLDEVEDLLLESAAYRQAGRVLLPKLNDVRGRPLTPLHGGHVGLLCTAGMLNGVFGEGESRHIAHWRSVKFTDHWEEEEEDGTKILRDRERFSHELTLVFARGKTQVLTHEKKKGECPPHVRFPLVGKLG